jgi:hypothetical protein
MQYAPGLERVGAKAKFDWVGSLQRIDTSTKHPFRNKTVISALSDYAHPRPPTGGSKLFNPLSIRRQPGLCSKFAIHAKA